jgi:membrane protein
MKVLLGIVLVVILVSGFIRAKNTGDIFNPKIIFAFPIFVSFCVNLVFYDSKMSISEDAYFIYMTSVACFCIGLYLGEHLKLFRSEAVGYSLDIKYNRNLFRLYFAIAIIGLFFAVQHIIRGVTYKIYGNHYLDNLRHYSTYVHMVSGLGKYGPVFANIIMLMMSYKVFILNNRCNKDIFLLCLSYVIYFIYMAMDLSRTVILFAFMTILFIYSIGMQKRKKFNKRFKIIIGIAVVMLFLCFDFIAKQTNRAIVANGDSWWVFYFGSQFYVLDYIIPFKGRLYGIKSLGIIGRALARAGLLPSAGRDELQVLLNSMGSPVSSFVSGPYLDYGIIGSVLVMIFYGICIGYIYKRYRRSGGLWIIAYATCVYQCVLAFYAFCFGDSMQIYIFVLLFLMCNTKINGFSYMTHTSKSSI